MKKLGWVFLLALALVGCGSNVKLDNVPVEDKTGAAVTGAGAAGAATGAAGGSAVAAVEAERAPGDERGPAATAHVIYFDFDSYVVKPEFQSVVEAHARYLRADPKRHAVLEGHTDERGGREYNLALGQKRAEAVARALSLLGVGSAQVEAVSFGKEKPAVDGHDEAAWAKNRRVEIKYR
ncbi:peptidoglycan-associated lipoprotein [Tibeticola sediminis]|uniref:Peptidoglycan-associated lipoprotein n=1 Tax=Tibeticola sediminis TaxID=1917811 RepID=A0A3N4UJ48_9BURK|nr:peptidoglycan-associated lipoprotein Pal [Tibeticola sediminis]RPE70696.1 peptidoglycan-associated lipoprotein [Tibeticola sediminis]